MENKNETKQELELNQMEKVSGGSEGIHRICSVCGKEYCLLSDPDHEFHCKKEQADQEIQYLRQLRRGRI